MALYQATIDDKPYIMALYTEAIGSEGCTWNEDYPSEETMDSDLARSTDKQAATRQRPP